MDLRIGDCVELLAAMPGASVDSVVTDPPYGLGFMGKQWDALPPGVEWAEQCLRVLKPGGHLVAFGGQRTIHRLTCALEDGGFEIRDLLGWLQWQGFPKSLNLPGGLGTGLKPALEPATLARKPFSTSVAFNVLAHRTGALNIDACRYAYGDPAWPGPQDSETARTRVVPGDTPSRFGYSAAGMGGNGHDLGRWPANIYACPKPHRGERDDGTEPRTAGYDAVGRKPGTAGLDNPRAGAGRTAEAVGNHHPTVKPVALMRWLCRLVTPPGGVVLDPFMGSGTTGIAALAEGFGFIGMEREADYVEIARARMLAEKERAGTLTAADVANSNARRQLGLFGT